MSSIAVIRSMHVNIALNAPFLLTAASAITSALPTFVNSKLTVLNAEVPATICNDFRVYASTLSPPVSRDIRSSSLMFFLWSASFLNRTKMLFISASSKT
eukprot:NODE_683_length_5225_cov_0.594616.p5 type:complete len:100 gc:universal NODE_683_length_5225_cov_0.594616:1466-1765(+)